MMTNRIGMEDTRHDYPPKTVVAAVRLPKTPVTLFCHVTKRNDKIVIVEVSAGVGLEVGDDRMTRRGGDGVL